MSSFSIQASTTDIKDSSKLLDSGQTPVSSTLMMTSWVAALSCCGVWPDTTIPIRSLSLRTQACEWCGVGRRYPRKLRVRNPTVGGPGPGLDLRKRRNRGRR
ncbi:hypothetical protein L1987_01599 [Smallanthus sonchifolius]|uniref:Uncharacterized protein n=1 Tax=Smallanthus sonchifolius TaxID=185202 RepID=A0ACB9K5I3_9ASTR|nr:hypothetical protein L1987_01599 [Smallanthus sonchifolius]